MLNQMKRSLAGEHIREFIEKMKQLGFDEQEICALLIETIKGEM